MNGLKHTGFRPLALALIAVLGFGLVVACGEDEPQIGGSSAGAREQTRQTLEELRDELREGIDPERKERLVRRCATALERLRSANDQQADRLANFCDSLESTNPNTPAAWDDIRARLNELITQFRG